MEIFYYTITKSVIPPGDVSVQKRCFVCKEKTPITTEDAGNIIICGKCAPRLLEIHDTKDGRKVLDTIHHKPIKIDREALK